MSTMLLFVAACTAPAGSGPDDAVVEPPTSAATEAASPTDTLLPLAAYRPEVVQGVVVLWHPGFVSAAEPKLGRRTRAALLYDLETIARVVPAAAMARLDGTRIAVAPRSPAPPGLPSKGRGVGFHRSARWLVANGLDAEREGVVEVYDATDYLTWRAEQPMLVLHALTYVLYKKADAGTLAALDGAYRAAVASGVYDAVPHILGAPGEATRARALDDAEQYAAELAEALFGRNDQYPFVASDLVAADPAGCAAVARLWSAACPTP